MSIAHTFKVGDCVKVKEGLLDPDFDVDIGGWQGRITMIDEFEEETIVVVQWDSVTLQNMSAALVEQCDEEGFDWSEISLQVDEVEPAVCRDDEHEVEHVIHKMEKHMEFAHLGERGERIQSVIEGIDEENYIDSLAAWNEYLHKTLSFPFAAKIDEFEEEYPFPRGEEVIVTGLDLVDDLYGIIADITHRGKHLNFPLCDLAAIDKPSPNYEAVKDYRVWFANR